VAPVTLFDASLLSTFQAAGFRRLFFAVALVSDSAWAIDLSQLSETILTVVTGLFGAPAQ
jgi:hypothetical protein